MKKILSLIVCACLATSCADQAAFDANARNASSVAVALNALYMSLKPAPKAVEAPVVEATK